VEKMPLGEAAVLFGCDCQGFTALIRARVAVWCVWVHLLKCLLSCWDMTTIEISLFVFKRDRICIKETIGAHPTPPQHEVCSHLYIYISIKYI
jgi:hypothetical protein